MIKIVINGQSISGEYTKTASDSVDYLRVYFSFSEEWQALVKTAQFTQEEKTYNALVEDGYCTVPSEISVGKVKLSVFGQMPGEALRITTLPFEFTMQKSGFASDGETAIPPTPDLYSQLVSKVQEAVDSVPEKLSDFENDAGYVTESSIPEKLSEFENDTGYITASEIPVKLSGFQNDTGYITASALPKKLSEIENDTGYMTVSDIPGKLSEFENDTGYITDEVLPKKLSQLDNDKGFITKENLFYDRVITSQEEWDAMIATEDWNGARNILLRCDITTNRYGIGGTIEIPENVVTIDGNGYSLGFAFVTIIAKGKNTSLRNCNSLSVVRDTLSKINGIYNCVLQANDTMIQECKNIIGCSFSKFDERDTKIIKLENCDTIILDTGSKDLFDSLDGWEIVDCSNIIYEKTKLSEFENDTGYITESAIPEKLSEFENDKGFITDEALPKKVSELENDAGYVTKTELVYDTIIHSQEEWDAMIDTEDWNGARNILLKCDVQMESGNSANPISLNVPTNVLSIDGNGFLMKLTSTNLKAVGSNTRLKNFNPISLEMCSCANFNGFYNNKLHSERGYLYKSKNIIGCDFSNTNNFDLSSCDTVILNSTDKNITLNNCTNVIYEKTKLSEFENDADFVTQTYVDELVGDIDSVLDELHSYAQAKISGGEA
ncbi:MAG: hypothetical protein E7621_01740 [Ruminococcaceae bacterium]|nr:hypothetical protein [Oscillospiraceae bacterium]